MSEIGEYLFKARQEQQISIRYLAKLTGISHSEINKIENGERPNPSALHLKALATTLGLNQITCFKLAGYIDKHVHEPLSNDIVAEQAQTTAGEPKDFCVKDESTTMSDSIKVASLFAGIGGICYGFKQAGAEIVWANEIDKDACKTSQIHYGLIDVTKSDIGTGELAGVKFFSHGMSGS